MMMNQTFALYIVPCRYVILSQYAAKFMSSKELLRKRFYQFANKINEIRLLSVDYTYGEYDRDKHNLREAGPPGIMLQLRLPLLVNLRWFKLKTENNKSDSS